MTPSASISVAGGGIGLDSWFCMAFSALFGDRWTLLSCFSRSFEQLAAHEALRRATGGRPSEKNTNGGVASAATNAALAAQTEADRGDIPWIRQMDL